MGGRTRLPEILGQSDPVGAKTPIFNRYSQFQHSQAMRSLAELQRLNVDTLRLAVTLTFHSLTV